MKTRFLAVIDRKRKSPWFALGGKSYGNAGDDACYAPVF